MLYTFSYDDIIDPTNKITKCLDDAWKHATILEWADPPGDLRYPGDSMPSITVSNIIVGSTEFCKTDDVLRVYVTLKPDEREHLIDAKIIVDPDEFQYLINGLAIDHSTHNICAYDDTRDDLKSMVVIKHFLEQLVIHIKPKFGLMYTSKVLREYDWLTRDQKLEFLCNKKEEKK
jgi:hypothetical protein